MKDYCTGCGEELSVVEYINDGVINGNYCLDCMTCSLCGEILPADRLAFMQLYQIKGQTAMMSVPAKECAHCIANPKLWKDVEEDVNIFN